MTMKNIILSGTLILIALFAMGCLVSGTFVISETFALNSQTGFYSDAINLENNEDWEEHRDKLDKVDVVGFELWVSDSNTVDWSFWAYMDDFDASCQSQACADTSSTRFLIFDTLLIPASSLGTGSTKFVSYAESFKYIQNQDKIKQMIFDGSFNFYGFTRSDEWSSGKRLDSIRVIITVNASDT